jgi:hypothetical protein
VQLGCRTILGPFCSGCHLEIVRYGNEEHGPKEIQK